MESKTSNLVKGRKKLRYFTDDEGTAPRIQAVFSVRDVDEFLDGISKTKLDSGFLSPLQPQREPEAEEDEEAEAEEVEQEAECVALPTEDNNIGKDGLTDKESPFKDSAPLKTSSPIVEVTSTHEVESEEKHLGSPLLLADDNEDPIEGNVDKSLPIQIEDLAKEHSLSEKLTLTPPKRFTLALNTQQEDKSPVFTPLKGRSHVSVTEKLPSVSENHSQTEPKMELQQSFPVSPIVSTQTADAEPVVEAINEPDSCLKVSSASTDGSFQQKFREFLMPRNTKSDRMPVPARAPSPQELDEDFFILEDEAPLLFSLKRKSESQTRRPAKQPSKKTEAETGPDAGASSGTENEAQSKSTEATATSTPQAQAKSTAVQKRKRGKQAKATEDVDGDEDGTSSHPAKQPSKKIESETGPDAADKASSGTENEAESRGTTAKVASTSRARAKSTAAQKGKRGKKGKTTEDGDETSGTAQKLDSDLPPPSETPSKAADVQKKRSHQGKATRKGAGTKEGAPRPEGDLADATDTPAPPAVSSKTQATQKRGKKMERGRPAAANTAVKPQTVEDSNDNIDSTVSERRPEVHKSKGRAPTAPEEDETTDFGDGLAPPSSTEVPEQTGESVIKNARKTSLYKEKPFLSKKKKKKKLHGRSSDMHTVSCSPELKSDTKASKAASSTARPANVDKVVLSQSSLKKTKSKKKEKENKVTEKRKGARAARQEGIEEEGDADQAQTQSVSPLREDEPNATGHSEAGQQEPSHDLSTSSALGKRKRSRPGNWWAVNPEKGDEDSTATSSPPKRRKVSQRDDGKKPKKVRKPREEKEAAASLEQGSAAEGRGNPLKSPRRQTDPKAAPKSRRRLAKESQPEPEPEPEEVIIPSPSSPHPSPEIRSRVPTPGMQGAELHLRRAAKLGSGSQKPRNQLGKNPLARHKATPKTLKGSLAAFGALYSSGKPRGRNAAVQNVRKNLMNSMEDSSNRSNELTSMDGSSQDQLNSEDRNQVASNQVSNSVFLTSVVRLKNEHLLPASDWASQNLCAPGLKSGPTSMVESHSYEDEEEDQTLPSTLRVPMALSEADICGPLLQPLTLVPDDWQNLTYWLRQVWKTNVKYTGQLITADHFHWYSYEGRALGHKFDLVCRSYANGKLLLGSYMKKPEHVDQHTNTVFNVYTSSVRVQIKDLTSDYNPGQAFVVPRGQSYSIRNLTPVPAILWYHRMFLDIMEDS